MYRFVTSVAFGILTLTAVAAQSSPPPKTMSPFSEELVLIASQPISPIRIESARAVSSPSHDKWNISFELRNVSARAVRRITPGLWTSLATGGTLQPVPETGELQPDAILKINWTYPSSTSELPNEAAIGVSPKVLLVLSIEEVTFTDGTRYSDNSTSKALMKYFESITDKIAETPRPPTPKH